MDKARLAEFKRRIDNLNTGDVPHLAPPLDDPNMQIAIERLIGSHRKPKDSKGRSPSSAPSLLFNRLEFDTETGSASSSLSSNKRGLAGTKSRLPKDPVAALAKVTSRQARLTALAEHDPQAAAAAQERDSWSRAIDKASGVAVRDDPKLLKRALVRRRRQKEARRGKWEERQRSVQEEQQHKQEKRRENIQNRKDAKKQKKARK